MLNMAGFQLFNENFTRLETCFFRIYFGNSNADQLHVFRHRYSVRHQSSERKLGIFWKWKFFVLKCIRFSQKRDRVIAQNTIFKNHQKIVVIRQKLQCEKCWFLKSYKLYFLQRVTLCVDVTSIFLLIWINRIMCDTVIVFSSVQIWINKQSFNLKQEELSMKWLQQRKRINSSELERKQFSNSHRFEILFFWKQPFKRAKGWMHSRFNSRLF